MNTVNFSIFFASYNDDFLISYFYTVLGYKRSAEFD